MVIRAMGRVRPLRPRCVFDPFFDLAGSPHDLTGHHTIMARLLIILINYGLIKS